TLHPGAEVAGAAAELDDILARDVRKHTHLALGDRPLAPGDLLLRPGVPRLLVGVLGVRLGPAVAVDRDVIGLSHRTRAAARARATSASGSRERGCRASRARTARGSSRGRHPPGSARPPSW